MKLLCLTGAADAGARAATSLPDRSRDKDRQNGVGEELNADNPGDWMFHCHIIEHQETGVMSYIRVA
jgi:Multicopper oxidase